MENATRPVSATPPKRILVHICCGPCSVAPLKYFLEGRAEVCGFFHNPNIHPKKEFLARLDAAKTLARILSLNVIFDEEYRPLPFIKGQKASSGDANVKHPPKDSRCLYCYATRLEETAKAAVANGFDAFSSSLLYSTSQRHDEIASLGVDLGRKYGIIFYYKDFRAFWQAGLDESKALGLYRQRYCGCIYSKIERYANAKPRKGARGGTL